MPSGPSVTRRSSWARRDCSARRSVRLDDSAAGVAFDGGVRLVDEALQPFGEPVIAPRLAALAVHALLDHDPAAVVGDDETVQIEIETVLHGGAIDFCNEPACGGEPRAVEAGALADRNEFTGRAARMLAAPAADMETKLARHRGEAALERAEHAGGDAGGMPIHPHHRAERLKPEWMREAAEKFVAAVMLDDRCGDHGAEPRHAVGQPFRHMAAVQRKVGASGSSGHLPSSAACYRHGASSVLISFLPRQMSTETVA